MYINLTLVKKYKIHNLQKGHMHYRESALHRIYTFSKPVFFLRNQKPDYPSGLLKGICLFIYTLYLNSDIYK